MTGDPSVISALIQRAIGEQSGIQQYSIVQSLFEIQGYGKLAAFVQEQKEDEQRHYHMVTRRLRELDAMPEAGIGTVEVSEDVRQILAFNNNREDEALAGYTELVRICEEVGDFVTRDLAVEILKDERDHRRDNENNLLQINQMTVQNYLSAQL